MMQNNYTVYMHINKVNRKKYIGITKQAPERRWQKGYGYVDNAKFWNAICKYGWDGFEHVVISNGLTKEQACALEIQLIFVLDTIKNGYNISPGGETVLVNPVYGADHPNAEAVKMIDPITMEVVAVFGAQSEAAREMGISRKGITKACRGECKTYKGYIWEYANKEYVKPKHYERGKYPHTKQQKKVTLHEVDGNVYFFNSVNEAAEKTGVGRSNISRYCLGMRKDASGRRWSYSA